MIENRKTIKNQLTGHNTQIITIVNTQYRITRLLHTGFTVEQTDIGRTGGIVQGL
jgi:L-alanine-DL-glutamate epimerase-like enolase superfamily enzyme